MMHLFTNCIWVNLTYLLKFDNKIHNCLRFIGALIVLFTFMIDFYSYLVFILVFTFYSYQKFVLYVSICFLFYVLFLNFLLEWLYIIKHKKNQIQTFWSGEMKKKKNINYPNKNSEIKTNIAIHRGIGPRWHDFVQRSIGHP